MGCVTLQDKATHAVWLESFTASTRGHQAHAEGSGGSRRTGAKQVKFQDFFLLSLTAQKAGSTWALQQCTRHPRARVPSSQLPSKLSDVLRQRL